MIRASSKPKQLDTCDSVTFFQSACRLSLRNFPRHANQISHYLAHNAEANAPDKPALDFSSHIRDTTRCEFIDHDVGIGVSLCPWYGIGSTLDHFYLWAARTIKRRSHRDCAVERLAGLETSRSRPWTKLLSSLQPSVYVAWAYRVVLKTIWSTWSREACIPQSWLASVSASRPRQVRTRCTIRCAPSSPLLARFLSKAAFASATQLSSFARLAELSLFILIALRFELMHTLLQVTDALFESSHTRVLASEAHSYD